MKKLILLLTIFISVFALSGCEKNPAGALMYNRVNESDPATWSNPFTLYRNGDIATLVMPFEKAIGAYTNIWENYAHLGNELEAQSKGESYSGSMSIKMKWSGDKSETYERNETVNNVSFWLTTTNTGGPRDLSAAGYTKISFWCKTDLRANTKAIINVFGHTYPSEDFVITTSHGWTYYERNISSYNHGSVNTYIIVTMEPASGSDCKGGTLYLDDIRLSK